VNEEIVQPDLLKCNVEDIAALDEK